MGFNISILVDEVESEIANDIIDNGKVSDFNWNSFNNDIKSNDVVGIH